MLLKKIRKCENFHQMCLTRHIEFPLSVAEGFFDYNMFYYKKKLYAIPNKKISFDISKCNEYLSDSTARGIAFSIIESFKDRSIENPILIDHAYGYAIFQFKHSYFATKSNGIKEDRLKEDRLNEYKCSSSLDELYGDLFQEHMNRLEIYIHTGLPKTGTTYLQRYIFPYLKGVHYIPKDGANEFFNYFVKIRFGNHLFLYEEIREKFIEYMKCVDETKILISEEALSEPRNNGRHFQPNTLILKKLFPSARIIFSIRHQIDLLESFYLQDLRVGGTMSINTFLRYDKRKKRFLELEYNLIPKLSVYYLDYIVFIDYYVELFGLNNVKVMIYEHLKKDKENFIYGLCSFIGTKYEKHANDTLVHRSYSKSSAYLALILNKITRRGDGRLALIVERPFAERLYDIVEKFDPQFINKKRRLKFIAYYILWKGIFITYNVLSKLEVHKVVDLADTFFRKLKLSVEGHVIDEEKRRILRKKYNRINKKLDEKYTLGLMKYDYYGDE